VKGGGSIISFDALVLSLLLSVIVFLIFIGINLLMKKEINADRFTPGWEREDDSNHKKFEGINSKGQLSTLSLIALVAVSGSMCGIIAYSITGKGILAFIYSFAGFIAPNVWYRWHKKNQETIITQQMEQAAETMASVLKSGGSMIAALDKAASETKDPLKKELVHTVAELRLGVSSTEAFLNLAKRVKLPEMLMLSMGIELQQKGMAINTANMLLQMQKNIRGRQLLQQEISSITAENKMSGWIVGSIPFITVALMRQFSPEFTDPLLNTPVGMTIFTICTFIILGGIYWIMSMANMGND